MIVDFDVVTPYKVLDSIGGVVPSVVLYPKVTVIVPFDDNCLEDLEVNVGVYSLVFIVVQIVNEDDVDFAIVYICLQVKARRRRDLLIEELGQIMLAGVVEDLDPFRPFCLPNNAFVRLMGLLLLFLRVVTMLSSVPTAELCVFLRQFPSFLCNPFFEFWVDLFESRAQLTALI